MSVLFRGVFREGGAVNSAKIGLYTGDVCLKQPNEWHYVTFEKYFRVSLATDTP